LTYYSSMRKRLDITILSIWQWVNVDNIAKGKISITYDGKVARSLWSCKLVLENKGNFDITEQMVRSPIAIGFPDYIEVLGAKVTPGHGSEGNLSIDQGKQVKINIKFLPRRKHVAIQLVLNLKDDKFLSRKDLNINPGIIENTEVKVDSMGNERVSRLNKFIFKYVEPFLLWMITLIGGGLVLFSTILIIFPNITILFDIALLKNNTIICVVLFVYGLGMLWLGFSSIELRRKFNLFK